MLLFELIQAGYNHISAMEFVNFHRKASPEQKQQMTQHLKNKDYDSVYNLMHDVTGKDIRPKPTTEEVQSPHPDVMGRNQPQGAGNDGTPELVKSYSSDTPGQKHHKKTLKTFKQFTNK